MEEIWYFKLQFTIVACTLVGICGPGYSLRIGQPFPRDRTPQTIAMHLCVCMRERERERKREFVLRGG